MLSKGNYFSRYYIIFLVCLSELFFLQIHEFANFLDLFAIIIIASAAADVADIYVQSEFTFWHILTPCRSHSCICEYACYVAVDVIRTCHYAAVERYVCLIINNGIVSDCLRYLTASVCVTFLELQAMEIILPFLNEQNNAVYKISSEWKW
jgi:hypothetical protein